MKKTLNKMAFRLKCRNKFYKSLGQFDAICEFTEVAVRDFLSNVKSETEFNDLLTEKSILHKIKVNAVELNIFRSRIAQSYILSVYQSFELFLREFKDEHSKLYNDSWKLPESTHSLLEKTIQKTSSMGKAQSVIGEFRLEIYEYYRLVRNKFAHEYIKDEKINKAYKNVKNYQNEIAKYYPNLNAPNTFSNICFDDFILFSRVVKSIADGLCDITAPENEEVFIKYYTTSNKFNKFNENSKRKRNAIKQDLIENFGAIDNLDSILYKIVPLV